MGKIINIAELSREIYGKSSKMRRNSLSKKDKEIVVELENAVSEKIKILKIKN